MFQQVIVVGRLGADPEMRYTPSGTPVANFRMAVSRQWTGQDGQQQEKTTWFRVTCWRRQAEIVSQYLTKGRQVMVVGEIEEPNAYIDRDGNPRASIEITAQNVKFIGGRNDMDSMGGGAPAMGNSGGGNTGGSGGYGAPAMASAPPQQAPGMAPTPQNMGAPALSDEDIPF